MIEAAVLCMALNLYHEGAKNESIDGLFAIAQVVLNRAKRDPEKVCDVVFAPHQFSWTSKPPVVEEGRPWENAVVVARLSFRMQDFTHGSDHYHAAYVKPYWRTGMKLTGQWGSHTFYRRVK
jgi:spore germination cell wall hydrolase CwlJ-like protein